MYSVIDGKLYELSEWANKHPGGSQIIKWINGRDATIEVYSNHSNHALVDSVLSKYLVDDANITKNNRIYVDKVYPKKYVYDDIIWITALSIYILDVNLLISLLSLIVIGGYGHQYVHNMSWKKHLLSFTGFVSNVWQHEHVLSHHIYTNTIYDVDLLDFHDIKKYMHYLHPAMRYFIVCHVILIRRVFTAPYHVATNFTTSSFIDFIIYCYNVYGFYNNFVYWYVKMYIINMWFLLIDYFNHYAKTPTGMQSSNWKTHQTLTTNNFVFNKWLYNNYPFIHSLLTFGLDRQVEHHLYPQVPMYYLSNIKCSGVNHVLSYETIKYLLTNFPE